MNGNKTYLGDGAYAEFEGYWVTLTTSDGLRDTNTIVLEPLHVQELIRFLKEKGWKL